MKYPESELAFKSLAKGRLAYGGFQWQPCGKRTEVPNPIDPIGEVDDCCGFNRLHYALDPITALAFGHDALWIIHVAPEDRLGGDNVKRICKAATLLKRVPATVTLARDAYDAVVTPARDAYYATVKTALDAYDAVVKTALDASRKALLEWSGLVDANA